ncbi:MAG TPA: sporulation membrane protein YtaF [Pseudogracilibacillus sp.]|nr:sporulation membrane protein YtaF [Pseudogracilibacillus sp.]
MFFISKLLAIAFAVSLDGFTVGMTYGLRKISITFRTLLVIVSCSGIVVFTAMTAGRFIDQFLPPLYAPYLGGLILFGLGLFLLSSIIWSKIKLKKRKKRSYAAFIKNPSIVDADNSGTLSLSEAFVLGIALALDALAAGFAAAILGFPILATTILIAFSSGLFVLSGFTLGHLLSHISWINRLTFLPPILLMIIGLLSFM